MAENNQMQKKITPRPKPNIVGKGLVGSNVDNLARKGIGARPKPNFVEVQKQVKSLPPRPMQNAPSGIPPRPPYQSKNLEPYSQVQNSNDKKNTQTSQNQIVQDPYSFQAYNNMLNNMQFMNAIGLVNGLYQQNAQINSRNNNDYSKYDKQSLFDEFYDYLTDKMKGDKSQVKEDNASQDTQSNSQQVAIKNAKNLGLSLDQYLQKMCNEDEFEMFGNVALEVGTFEDVPSFGMITDDIEISPIGKVDKIEEYTNDDYIHLLNREYDYFIPQLGVVDAQEIQSAEIEQDEDSCEIEAVEEVEADDIAMQESQILDTQSVQEDNDGAIVEDFAIQEENLEDKAVDFEDEAQADENLDKFEKARNDDIELGDLNIDNASSEDFVLSEFEDVRDDEVKEPIRKKSNLEKEEIFISDDFRDEINQILSETSDDDEPEGQDFNQIISNLIEDEEKTYQEQIDAEDMANEQAQEQTDINDEDDTIFDEEFDDEDEESLNEYSEDPQESTQDEKEKEINDDYSRQVLDITNEENDRLKAQLDEYKGIVEYLKGEIVAKENQAKDLEEKVKAENESRKQIQKEIERKNELSKASELDKLQSENAFIKSVVDSLMDEIATLKSEKEKIEKTKQQIVKESKIDKKQNNVIEDKKNLEDQKSTVQVEQVQVENLQQSQNVVENAKIDDKNLFEVNDEVFNDDTYNVDGILVEEETLETSQHFVDKMKIASKEIQDIYNEIRNEIMSYKEVKGRFSSACDTFRLDGDVIAKFLLIGKTMKLYLALNPMDENLPQNIYHQKDESKKKAYKETPFMVKIQSKLGVRKAIKLITYMFDNLDVVKNPRYKEVDYVATMERQVVAK